MKPRGNVRINTVLCLLPLFMTLHNSYEHKINLWEKGLLRIHFISQSRSSCFLANCLFELVILGDLKYPIGFFFCLCPNNSITHPCLISNHCFASKLLAFRRASGDKSCTLMSWVAWRNISETNKKHQAM